MKTSKSIHRTQILRMSLAASAIVLAAVMPERAVAVVPDGTPVFTHPLNITNRYHPFQPGGTKVFTGTDEGQKVMAVDHFLAGTRLFEFNGATVECRILREYAFEEGQLVEISDNYFAQADDGTVYYFGEVVDNYESGVVANHEGSWLVGGPAATDPQETAPANEPAVFMPATPELGDIFKPEDLFPLVDETAEVISTDEKVRVPAGRYKNVLLLKESTRLSPTTERKWYAPGVGVVLVKGKTELLKLAASTLAEAPQ